VPIVTGQEAWFTGGHDMIADNIAAGRTVSVYVERDRETKDKHMSAFHKEYL
jgi:hypothetical protein